MNINGSLEADTRAKTEAAMIVVYDQLLEAHGLEGLDAMEHLAGDLPPQTRAALSAFVAVWENLAAANRV